MQVRGSKRDAYTMGSQKAQKADYTLSVTGRKGAAVSIAVSGWVALDSLQALIAEVRAVLRDPAPGRSP